MGQTAVYHLPYPETTDPADAHAQIMALANAIETALAGQAIVPVGAIIDWPYASGSIPSWALLPYGQNISRATYAALNTVASAAGYPHGVGDGSSTFALPDLRGRVLAGKDDMGGTAAGRITAAVSGANGTVLGVAVGAEGITLTTAMIPAHSHTGVTGNDSPDHTHAGSTSYDSPDHTHSGNTGNESADHGHAFTTGDRSAGHTHTSQIGRSQGYGLTAGGAGFANNVLIVPGAGGTLFGYTTDGENVGHSHGGSTGGRDTAHYHSFGTSGASARHTHTFTSGGRSAYHTHPITSEGGGAVHRNMAPTLIVNMMMRAL